MSVVSITCPSPGLSSDSATMHVPPLSLPSSWCARHLGDRRDARRFPTKEDLSFRAIADTLPFLTLLTNCKGRSGSQIAIRKALQELVGNRTYQISGASMLPPYIYVTPLPCDHCKSSQTGCILAFAPPSWKESHLATLPITCSMCILNSQTCTFTKPSGTEVFPTSYIHAKINTTSYGSKSTGRFRFADITLKPLEPVISKGGKIHLGLAGGSAAPLSEGAGEISKHRGRDEKHHDTGIDERKRGRQDLSPPIESTSQNKRVKVSSESAILLQPSGQSTTSIPPLSVAFTPATSSLTSTQRLLSTPGEIQNLSEYETFCASITIHNLQYIYNVVNEAVASQTLRTCPATEETLQIYRSRFIETLGRTIPPLLARTLNEIFVKQQLYVGTYLPPKSTPVTTIIGSLKLCPDWSTKRDLWQEFAERHSFAFLDRFGAAFECQPTSIPHLNSKASLTAINWDGVLDGFHDWSRTLKDPAGSHLDSLIGGEQQDRDNLRSVLGIQQSHLRYGYFSFLPDQCYPDSIINLLVRQRWLGTQVIGNDNELPWQSRILVIPTLVLDIAASIDDVSDHEIKCKSRSRIVEWMTRVAVHRGQMKDFLTMIGYMSVKNNFVVFSLHPDSGSARLYGSSSTWDGKVAEKLLSPLLELWEQSLKRPQHIHWTYSNTVIILQNDTSSCGPLAAHMLETFLCCHRAAEKGLGPDMFGVPPSEALQPEQVISLRYQQANNLLSELGRLRKLEMGIRSMV